MTVPCHACCAENAPGSRFCMSCGASQDAPVVPTATAVCGQCGTTVANVKFCPSCGSPCASSHTAAPQPPRRQHSLDMSDVEERRRQHQALRAEQERRAEELVAAKRSLAEAKFAALERQMNTRGPPPTLPHASMSAFKALAGTPPPPPPPLSAVFRPRAGSTGARHSGMMCGQCGTDVTGLKFCPSCGTPAPPPLPTPVISPMPSVSTGGSCRQCGTNTNNMKFCLECGTPVQAPSHISVTPVVAATTHCSQCGHDVTNMKFCLECGTPVQSRVPQPGRHYTQQIF
ncbi:hypothetical protein AC1031_001366 [Aphanomyces cochlioides]|nr:hypothetical protein AC1031_001366 [Aphanomyces cochlioides]